MQTLVDWIKRHPGLIYWALLSLGMVAVLVYEARDENLMPGAWAALVLATILVAGACVWIINWE